MPSPTMEHKNYNRMKYYSALKTVQQQEEKKKGGERRDSWLQVPEHLMLDL